MNHLFVPYELAVKLKEKGFDDDCVAVFLNKELIWYDKRANMCIVGSNKYISISADCVAPLYQQVVDWLWDKHMIFISIVRESLGSDEWEFGYHIEWLPKDCWDLKKRSTSFKYKNSYIESPGGTYYGAWPTISEALTKAIEEALKLI